MKRRRFLGEASCSAIGSMPILSTLMNLSLANHAVAQTGFGGGRKTLVCVFLSGGCDTFNVLVPGDAERYGEYVAARSNLALPMAGNAGLIRLNPVGGEAGSYGLHPSCVKLAEMFHGMGGNPARRRVSFLSNVGTLVEPIESKAAYLSGSVALPQALFSHRDQIEQWQTSVPQGMQVLTGWGGRAADLLHSAFNTEQTGGFYMPMNFSLSGNSAFQIGESEGQFVINGRGALSFTGAGQSSPVLQAKDELIRATVASPVEEHYRSLFQRTHGRITANSIERGREFQQYFATPGMLNGKDVAAVIAGAGFPDHWVSESFRGAVKTIAIRQQLRLARQTIFIEFGGWDHHAELLSNQEAMLAALDGMLYAFQVCLEELGLADDVVTFTCSDFGRTLRSNGQGTDHAWSGHQIVMGGPVSGGRVAGTYPSLVIDGPDDIGRGGRIFPRVSVDEYFCELLRWFGVSSGEMESVLPNIRRFYDPASVSGPLGLIGV